MLMVIDDFQENAHITRENALKAEYISVVAQDITYHGICQTNFDEYVELFNKKLGFEIEPAISFFRYYTKDLRSPNYIHADLNFCDYIAVQFLHEDLNGGFATWSHVNTGLTKAKAGYSTELLELLKNDSQDEENWRMETLVNARFNRCVIYPAQGFHSHYPKQLWGTGPLDGRLVQVFFFNRKVDI